MIYQINSRAARRVRNQWRNVVKTISEKIASLMTVGVRPTSGWLKTALILAFGMVASLAVAQPTNDNFASATVISGTAGALTNESNVGATMEAGEQTSIIADDTSPFSVSVMASDWYSWTAPANGNVTFDTIGSGLDTVLAAYTGNGVANLTLLAANDDVGTNRTSQIGFYAVANTTYFVAVYGAADGVITESNVVLHWTMQTPGFSAGQFRFTSTSYSASQRESLAAKGGSGMSATAGARVSVTRVGGSAGRVLVPYMILLYGDLWSVGWNC
jgi:hypothetical protein